MSNRIKSVHEVYFLVRVGTWGEEELNKWLQDNIDASYNDDSEEVFADQWEETDDWDLQED